MNEDKIRVINQFLIKNQLKRKQNLPIEKITDYIIKKKDDIAIFELAKTFNSTISTFGRNLKKNYWYFSKEIYKNHSVQ